MFADWFGSVTASAARGSSMPGYYIRLYTAMMGIVGRDESLRLLAGAMGAAQAGRGCLVMVRADPGLGVTALLDAHLEVAKGEGLRTYRIPVLPPGGRTTLSDGVPDWAEPAVVVVDDLHFADDATLLALHELVHHLPDRPLQIVTGRAHGPASGRFAQLDRLGLVHDLPPLDEDAIRVFAGDQPADEAAGNPWLLTQLGAADRVTIVTAWAERLAGDDQGLLRYAALMDDPVTVDDLAAVTGEVPDEVLAGVRRLAASALVEHDAALVRLRHPMVRGDLATTAAGLRGSVARALAGHGAAPAAIARQFARAPMTAWTMDWLTEHADALATCATPETVALLDRAVARLRPGDSHLYPMHAALAEARLWCGQLDDARDTANASLAARPDPLVRQRLRAVLANAAVLEMDPAAITAALDPERDNGVLPPRLAALDALACLLAGDLAGMSQSVEQATPAAEEDPVVEVSLLNLRAIEACVTNDFRNALDLLNQVEALLDAAVFDRQQWLLAKLLRAVMQDVCRDGAALDTVERVRPVATRLGAGVLAWLHTIAALAAVNNGRWNQAIDEVDAAMAMSDQYGMARPLHGIAATVLLHRGDLPAARARGQLAEEAVGRGVALYYEQVTLLTKARLFQVDGDIEQSLEIVRDIVEGGVGVHHGHAVVAAGIPLVRTALAAEDHGLATRLVTEMTTWIGSEPIGESAIKYCQALVNGDVDVLLAVAKEEQESGFLLSAAVAAEDAATLLAATGKFAEAREVHQTVIDRYAALAADGDISRVGAALRARGVRPGATGTQRRPKHGWDSLTGAEYRVAELVALGNSNKEVAAQLFLSVRTVHSHVSRTLAKLGYSSRIEIALGFQQRD